jgi:hypothetical protein
MSAQNRIAVLRMSFLVPKALCNVRLSTPAAFVRSAIDVFAKPFTDKTCMTLRKTVARSTAVPPFRGRVSVLFAMIATAHPLILRGHKPTAHQSIRDAPRRLAGNIAIEISTFGTVRKRRGKPDRSKFGKAFSSLSGLSDVHLGPIVVLV